MHNDLLAWVDIETTGLELEHAVILEVGLVITDGWLEPIHSESHVIGYHHPTLLRETCIELVQKMHDQSGLWTEIGGPAAVDLEEAEQRLLATMDRFSREADARPPMCGSSVHFDRSFLHLNMPSFEAAFRYRNIDVSTLKELARIWNPPIFDKRPHSGARHRAIPDLQDTLAEARHYRDNLIFT